MNTRRWLLWVFANTIGAAFGWFFYVNLMSTINLTTIIQFPGIFNKNLYIYSTVLGLTIGLAQGLVLLPLIRIDLWIKANIIGWVIGFLASFLTFFILFASFYEILSLITYFMIYAVSASVLGICIGLSQLLALSTKFTGIGVQEWILTNICAFGISSKWFVEGLDALNNNDEASGGFSMTLFGLLYGIITAKVFVKLWRD